MKSSKIISIVFLNTIFPTGDPIPRFKYIACIFISIGLVIFNLKLNTKKASCLLGIILCLISLLFDGMLSNIQDRNKKKL
jgi:drug/metabolite transporter (DMT)-like permease